MKPTGNVRPIQAVRRDKVKVRIEGVEYLLVRLHSGGTSHKLYRATKDALGHVHYREVQPPTVSALLGALFEEASA